MGLVSGSEENNQCRTENASWYNSQVNKNVHNQMYIETEMSGGNLRQICYFCYIGT